MSPSFAPEVAGEIFVLRPDYCALSLVALGVDNAATPCVQGARSDAQEWLRNSPPPWQEAHFEAWRAAYRAFGAKPQRTPPSAEALRKRMDSTGQLPSVNAAVDLYNAISVRYALPVGGENIAAYDGRPRLVRASGDESFDTIKEGAAHIEHVPAGEVIWRDERGATCRRWNWRQGVRTRIDQATQEMWFVLERLEPMPVAALLEAGRELAAAIAQLSPAARLSSALIDQSGFRTPPRR